MFGPKGDIVTKESKNRRKIAGMIFEQRAINSIVLPPPQLDLSSGIYTVWNSPSSESEESFPRFSDRDQVTFTCSSEKSIGQAEADDMCDFFKNRRYTLLGIGSAQCVDDVLYVCQIYKG